MEAEYSLVFSRERSTNPLIVLSSGAKWTAHFQDNPSDVFVASFEGIQAYLELLYIANRAPFDSPQGGTFDRAAEWTMSYKVGGNVVLRNTGEHARLGQCAKYNNARISIFGRVVKNGLLLLACKAKIADKYAIVKDAPFTMPKIETILP